MVTIISWRYWITTFIFTTLYHAAHHVRFMLTNIAKFITLPLMPNLLKIHLNDISVLVVLSIQFRNYMSCTYNASKNHWKRRNFILRKTAILEFSSNLCLFMPEIWSSASLMSYDLITNKKINWILASTRACNIVHLKFDDIKNFWLKKYILNKDWKSHWYSI